MRSLGGSHVSARQSLERRCSTEYWGWGFAILACPPLVKCVRPHRVASCVHAPPQRYHAETSKWRRSPRQGPHDPRGWPGDNTAFPPICARDTTCSSSWRAGPSQQSRRQRGQRTMPGPGMAPVPGLRREGYRERAPRSCARRPVLTASANHIMIWYILMGLRN